jgi:hypothetical protein
MHEKLPLLYHHGDMLGFIEHIRTSPEEYGKKHLTVNQAVEIYLTDILDPDPLYRTDDPEVRK